MELIKPISQKEVSPGTVEALEYIKKAEMALTGESEFRIKFPGKKGVGGLYDELNKNRDLALGETSESINGMQDDFTPKVDNLNKEYQFITWDTNDSRNEHINDKIPDIAFESKNMA